jgi:hypothetical protein
MWTKQEKRRAVLWRVIILCAMVALAIGLYHLLMKAALSNENGNLAITFDEYGYTKTHFEGTVTFKKDFSNVSLDMYFTEDSRYQVSGESYTLLLTNEDGEEVTDVKAGHTYHFIARVEFEETPDYKWYIAGQEVQSKSKSKVWFKADGKTLYTISFGS